MLEKEDLKTEEEETSTEGDQSVKKQDSDTEEVEEVKISKSELEELRKKASDGENYKKAVISNNRKSRTLPGLEPKSKPAKKEVDEYGDEITPKEKYVTESEMDKRDQDKAISEACKDDDIALNWTQIVEFYTPPAVKGYNNTLAAINKAYKLYKADKNANTEPGESEKDKIAKKAIKDLSSDKGVNKGKEKAKNPEKKSILGKTEGMDKWYK